MKIVPWSRQTFNDHTNEYLHFFSSCRSRTRQHVAWSIKSLIVTESLRAVFGLASRRFQSPPPASDIWPGAGPCAATVIRSQCIALQCLKVRFLNPCYISVYSSKDNIVLVPSNSNSRFFALDVFLKQELNLNYIKHKGSRSEHLLLRHNYRITKIS